MTNKATLEYIITLLDSKVKTVNNSIVLERKEKIMINSFKNMVSGLSLDKQRTLLGKINNMLNDNNLSERNLRILNEFKKYLEDKINNSNKNIEINSTSSNTEIEKSIDLGEDFPTGTL